MGRKSNKQKIIELLEANGYELQEYYVDNRTEEEEFRMDSWIHKETKQWLAADFNLVESMKFLLKLGIDKKITHGLGFSSKDQKWYGWSHRAIYGFGIGSKVKKGDCAYSAKNETDFIDDLGKNELNKQTHDIHLNKLSKDGVLVVTYTYKGDPEDSTQDKYIGDQEVQKYRFDEKGWYQIHEMVECGDPDCPYKGKQIAVDPELQEAVLNSGHECEYVPAEPEEYFTPWGKGEWTAKTLDDAKQMAIDFSKSVS